MHTAHEYSDNPARTSGEGELPHEQPKRRSDQDNRESLYDGKLIPDCEVVFSREKALAAQKEAARIISCYKAAHSCRQYVVAGICMVCEKAAPDSVVGILQDMKANADNILKA